MPHSNEHEWAVALKKNRQRIVSQAHTPLAARFQHAAEEMAYIKTQLSDAMRSHDAAAAERLLKQLIDMRAAQAAMQIERAESLYGRATTYMIIAITERYAKDCARLVSAASVL